MMVEGVPVQIKESIVLEKFEGEPENGNIVERVHIEDGAIVRREYITNGEIVRVEEIGG